MSTLNSNVDAYADQDFPAKNFGGEAKLRINGTGDGDDQQAFVFFARPFPLGAKVVSATLHLVVADDMPGARDFTVKRVTERWGENSIAWSNRPAVDAGNLEVVTVTDAVEGDVIDFDVGGQLQDAADGDGFFGFRVESNEDVTRKFWSSDAPKGAKHPTLDVEFRLAPEAPTNLTPSGGQVISVAKPRVSWKFTDREGEQASSQYQLAEADDFAVLDYDSGKQANTDPAWDLAATAYAGIPDGESRFARARVWNDADQVSEWSDVVEFTRVALPVLTLLNPDVAPNNFVEETTPPFAIDFADQSAVQWVLERVNEKGARIEIWRKPREATAVQTVHPPKNLLKSKNLIGQPQLYVLTVRAWDSEERRSIAGDPSFAEVSRSFTYQRSGAPAAVDALTATPDGPFIDLAFHRAAMPDFFSVRVNEREEAQRIDPAAIALGGGNYAIRWCRAVHGVVTTYEVEAVVNDEHSDGNATDDAASDARGVWLIDESLDDPDDQLAVRLMSEGDSPPSLALGEAGQTLEPVGGKAPVRITSAERGFEGNVSGVLADDAAVRDFRELKRRANGGAQIRFIDSTINVPVGIGEVGTLRPRKSGRKWDVGFDVFQVDEFDDGD